MNKIFGIGTDIIRNSRIENLLQRPYKKRFISRVLHSVEIEEFNNITSLKLQARYLASRWALKEALVKASNRKDLRFPAIFVKKDKNGKPAIELEEASKIILEYEIGITQIHLSLSHEDEYSIAFIILEK